MNQCDFSSNTVRFVSLRLLLTSGTYRSHDIRPRTQSGECQTAVHAHAWHSIKCPATTSPVAENISAVQFLKTMGNTTLLTASGRQSLQFLCLCSCIFYRICRGRIMICRCFHKSCGVCQVIKIFSLITCEKNILSPTLFKHIVSISGLLPLKCAF